MASDIDDISLMELQLAARNHGMPLEALQWDVTPIGLHYLLIHFDIPAVDANTWRLQVGGLVNNEMTLTLDELRARPAVTAPVTFECAGNGRVRLSPRPASQPWISEAVGTAEWTGTPLRLLLDEAGLKDHVVEVTFAGLDRGIEGGVEHIFERSLTLDEALRDDVLLAYEINGEPLPPQHGFPLRLVVPGWYGMTNVKWLERIAAVAEPFTGVQQAKNYRFKLDSDDTGTPLSRMRPRALMVPPGTPDFPERRRFVPVGRRELVGKAWSGSAPISRVEVSTDGGATWSDADLRPGPPGAWSSWTFAWDADQPGEVELLCRATDEAGNVQPDEPEWNAGGYVNNSVQRVPVSIVGDPSS
jgi:DMSO/TMAO reductase YedYZ molybdopterin-dependent catalytic subunit